MMETQLVPPALSTSSAPFIIYDDNRQEAEALAQAIRLNGRTTEIYNERADLLKRARELPRAAFAIDIDHGERKRQEGLEAIKELSALKRQGRNFLIATLTSHRDFERKASRVGADAFLAKTEVKTDALELLALAVARERDELEREGERIEKQIAEAEYERLRGLWLDLAQGAKESRFHPATIKDLEHGFSSALRRPFASPEERALIAALEVLLRRIQEQEEPSDVDCAVIGQGFDLLAEMEPRTPETIEQWLATLAIHGQETHLRWLDDDDDEYS